MTESVYKVYSWDSRTKEIHSYGWFKCSTATTDYEIREDWEPRRDREEEKA